MTSEKDSSICCPLFIPEKWDQKTHHWNNKPFIMSTIPAFMHIPFPPMIGWKASKMDKLADEANKLEPNKEDTLLLFHDPSAFKTEMYMSVTGEVIGANNTVLNGDFISKVFQGSYQDIPRCMAEFETYLNNQNNTAIDHYIHYAYCPKCMKKYGHNYILIFAKIQ